VLIVANESMALVCQFIQHTDPRFPLVCFTADSVLLAALTAVIASRWRRAAWLPAVRIRSAVAVLLSAVIFIAVITPATPTGTGFQPWDDAWLRSATVLMHGTAPLLVTLDLTVQLPWRQLPTWIASGLATSVLLRPSSTTAVITSRLRRRRPPR